MENFALEASELTPEIKLDVSTYLFEFNGNSSPEDALSFYNPVMNWLEKYAATPGKETVVEFKLDYINSASSKIILHIMFTLKRVLVDGNKLFIKWYFQEIDEEMKEAGETYAEIIELPFEFIPTNSLK